MPLHSAVFAAIAMTCPMVSAAQHVHHHQTTGAEAAIEPIGIPETAVKLAFVAAIQFLPPKQRAVLLLSDVVGWSAAETAQLLGSSTASTNSALQRARHSRRALSAWPSHAWLVTQSRRGRLLQRYKQAWQSDNLDGFIELLRDDAIYTMPPWGEWYQGRADIRAFFETVWTRFTGYRVGAIGANAQPAIAVYARTLQDATWRADSLHLIEPSEDGITSLTVYIGPLGPNLFKAFGLPPVQ